MSDSLCLDLEQFGDPESQAIAALGAVKNDLGSAWTFIRNRRTLAEYCQCLVADRKLRRLLNPRKWSVEPY
jgi:hypothetical protein